MKKKGLTCLLLSGILSLELVLPAAAAQPLPPMPDTAQHWAADAIEEWHNYGVVHGDAETGAFRPDASLTRAEFAAMLQRLIGYQESGDAVYSDVPSDSWYAADLSRLSQAGVLQGDGDGSLRPGDPISRQEAAVMLCRALQLDGSGSLTFTDLGDIAP